MIFPWTLTCLITTHLISLAMNTVGEVFLWRDFIKKDNGMRQARLSCGTNDDKVWHGDIGNENPNTELVSKSRRKKNSICANDCCTATWRINESNWEIVDPNTMNRARSIHDSRREDFSMYTTKIDTILWATPITLAANNLCIELRADICAKCTLAVELIDSAYTALMAANVNLDVRSNSEVYKYYTVKWTIDSTKYNSSANFLRFTSKRKDSSTNGKWWIRYFRECQRKGTVRKCSFNDDTEKWSESKNKNILCQRLSSSGNSVVRWIPPHDSNNISSNLKRCLQDEKPHFCKLQCAESCKGTFICDESGCVCGPGFKGSDCEDPINSDFDHKETSKVESSTEWFFILLITVAVSIFIIIICRTMLAFYVNRTRREISKADTQHVIDITKSTVPRIPEQSSPSLAVNINETESLEICAAAETVQWNRHPAPIEIKEFEEYVKNSIISGLLSSQFAMFPKGLNKPCEFGALPVNGVKNRYKKILPYDETRVILATDENYCRSDYINANYIEGFKKKKAYIATQGPKRETLNDFWRMVWEENSTLICMLTNLHESGKKKCEQYWPEIGTSYEYGNIVVMTTDQQVFADYTYRSFRVKCDEQVPRKIEHLQYTSWRDHSIPLYTHPIIAYLKRILRKQTEGPVIVHCSAGIGRTGTIILCDICLRQAAVNGTVNVLHEFKKLRESRMNMVDNELQYIFAHVVLAECFITHRTELPCNNQLPLAIEKLKKQVPFHVRRLRDTEWQDQALHYSPKSSTPPLAEHLAKNRFPELAPDCSALIYLTRYPTHDPNSDYISAVVVDGFTIKRQFVASQLPMPSTLPDLWRLIAEQHIEFVIVLQKPDLLDPTCCDIIPGEELADQVPYINVQLISKTVDDANFEIDELLLTNTSEAEISTQNVTVITCLEWGVGKGGKPPPPEVLVSLWSRSQNVRIRNQGPTLVLCLDGVTGSGLYLALSFLLERMAVERECDVILAARAVRRARPKFLQSQEQFKYLYNAAATYITTFEMYANFD